MTIDGRRAVVRIDSSLYSRDVVLRSLYWFTNRVYGLVSQPTESLFEISLELQDDCEVDASEVAGEFLNALVDYSVRASIHEQTATLRELIVAKAFAEPGLLEDVPPGDVSDPVQRTTEAQPAEPKQALRETVP